MLGKLSQRSFAPWFVNFRGRPVVQLERIVIQNKYGDKLVGLLHDTGSKEVVVLCHGFTSNKEDRLLVRMASLLVAEDISAFCFDFSGNGESEGTFQFANHMNEVDDLSAFVKHFNGAKREVTAIVGASKGANVVLLYASKYHDVRSVVNVSGLYDMQRGLKILLGEDILERIEKESIINIEIQGKIFCATKESILEHQYTKMQEACLKIDEECRVLTVVGSADELIPLKEAHEFDEILPNHKLYIVEGADHCYTKDEHAEELAGAVVNFVKACIQRDRRLALVLWSILITCWLWVFIMNCRQKH